MTSYAHQHSKRAESAERAFLATIAEFGADAPETSEAFRALTITSARAVLAIRQEPESHTSQERIAS